jgi:hypothetical protein
MPHVPRSQDDEYQRLSLRAELFLIAHDDDTGRRHIDKRRLALGLAAAVLLELWLACRIRIGWRPDARYAAWHPNPGQITILDASPTGDPIIDTALRLLWNLGGTPKISDFVRQFAATNLYDRVRGQMIATGILRRATRRRFRFFRAETYLSSHPRFPVRARTGVRNLDRAGPTPPARHRVGRAGHRTRPHPLPVPAGHVPGRTSAPARGNPPIATQRAGGRRQRHSGSQNQPDTPPSVRIHRPWSLRRTRKSTAGTGIPRQATGGLRCVLSVRHVTI